MTRNPQRDAAIVAFYVRCQNVQACAEHFALSDQRILQIVKAAGVWQPRVKGDRTQFLGVQVSEETKSALHQRARTKQTSVSRLVSDVLDDEVQK